MKGFIELFTMSVILHNKSVRFFVSITTKPDFPLSFDFLTEMFPELYFRWRSEKISRSQGSFVTDDMKFYHSKHYLQRCHSQCIYYHTKTFLTKKTLWIAKLPSIVLCAFSHKSIWRGLSLLEEAVTVDGGKISANDFSVLFEQKKFLILILLAADTGAVKNCSRSASLEPFHSTEALVLKVCLGSKRSFRSTHFYLCIFHI